jgi:hypothetical protein
MVAEANEATGKEHTMRATRHQTGMTPIATLFVIALVVLGVFLALKLVPVYLEYFNVVSSVNSLRDDPDLGQKSKATVRKMLKRRFDINDVKRAKIDNVKITRSGGKTIVAVEYEARVPLVSNIDLIISFSKTAEFP